MVFLYYFIKNIKSHADRNVHDMARSKNGGFFEHPV